MNENVIQFEIAISHFLIGTNVPFFKCLKDRYGNEVAQ